MHSHLLPVGISLVVTWASLVITWGCWTVSKVERQDDLIHYTGLKSQLCPYHHIQLCACACMLSHFSCVWLSAILWIITCQVPLSMGLSRQGYWSGLQALLQGLHTLLPCQPRDWTCISYASCIEAGGFLTTSTTWEALSSFAEQQSWSLTYISNIQ